MAYAVSPSSEIRLGSDLGRMIPVTLGSVRTPDSDRSIAPGTLGRRPAGRRTDRRPAASTAQSRARAAAPHVRAPPPYLATRSHRPSATPPRAAATAATAERGAPDDQDRPPPAVRHPAEKRKHVLFLNLHLHLITDVLMPVGRSRRRSRPPPVRSADAPRRGARSGQMCGKRRSSSSYTTGAATRSRSTSSTIWSGIVPVIAVSDLDHDVVAVSAVNEVAGEPSGVPTRASEPARHPRERDEASPPVLARGCSRP